VITFDEYNGTFTLFHMYYGPEYLSDVLVTWARENNILIQYIQPGNPEL